MASIVSSLFSGGIEGAGKGVAAVVNAIKGRNPEDAAKLQELLTKHEDLIIQTNTELAKARMTENVQLNETAGQNIRSEQNSRYSAWARPSVIYAWIGVIVYNYIVCGFMNRVPLVMPDMFWEVSAVVITGYVFARSGDKLLGGAGGTLQGLGMKIESKGTSTWHISMCF
jgi:hypothetical protein